MNLPGGHPLHRGAPGISPTPPDTDCLLVIDAVVPWQTWSFEPQGVRRIIRIAIDPIERMTPIYEFPSDLSISADPVKAVPALVDELRSLMMGEGRRRCQARLERYRRVEHRVGRARRHRREGRRRRLSGSGVCG
jgi:thiamine pyrophosphate-dependent acetolactate synthase large subunit-like protein